MNLDFLKAVNAKIEGRTVVVVSGLVFCCFGMWIAAHLAPSTFSTVLLSLFAVLGCGTVMIPLLGKPQPSEPTPKFVVQQVGNQTFYTGGHHSTDEMISLLREARNIQPLPAPAALVIGSPKDQQYKPLSISEAEELQRKDEMQINELLRSEIETMQARLAGGPVQDTRLLQASPPVEKAASNSQAVIADPSSILDRETSGTS